MKLNQEQINEIRNLKLKGLKQMEIASQLGFSQRTVSYWLRNESDRKEISRKTYEKFKSKPIEERRKIYKKRLPYIRDYVRKKYHEDSIWREKQKLKVHNSYIKKHNGL